VTISTGRCNASPFAELFDPRFAFGLVRSARVDPSEQLPMEGGEQVLPGTGRGELETRPPHAHLNDGGDLQQLDADFTMGMSTTTGCA
jgi:hypothetical protein